MSSLDAVSVFVKVIESGSFSGAARLLGMPKTTVSAKVAALERELGVKLIQRTTRRLHVTDAGNTYFRHCINAIRELSLGEAAVQAVQSRPTGLLRVTAPVDIGHVVLPRIARTFLERYPETSIELLISNRKVDLIGEGFDLAIRAGTLKDSSLIAQRFFDVRATLWASPAFLRRVGRILHPKNLAALPFVCFKGFDKLTLTNGRNEIAVPMTGRVWADDLEAIKALAILGEGLAWLPEFLAADAVKRGDLVAVLPAWRSKGLNGMHFVYASREYTLPKVQAFMQVALDTVNART